MRAPRERLPRGSNSLTQRPDGSWQASWLPRGRRPDGTRNPRIYASGRTSAEVLEKLDRRKRELDHRPATVRSAHTVTTWSGQWLEYLRVKRGSKPSTVRAYDAKLRIHILPALGDGPPLGAQGAED